MDRTRTKEKVGEGEFERERVSKSPECLKQTRRCGSQTTVARFQGVCLAPSRIAPRGKHPPPLPMSDPQQSGRRKHNDFDPTVESPSDKGNSPGGGRRPQDSDQKKGAGPPEVVTGTPRGRRRGRGRSMRGSGTWARSPPRGPLPGGREGGNTSQLRGK